MDTLELLNKAAKHLSGYDVLVKIQEPEGSGIGECWFELTEAAVKNEEPALKIAISPRAVADGNQYLDVFLHEVAHAKLHSSMDEFERDMKWHDNDPEKAWKMEAEASRLAAMWKHYAARHYGPYLDNAGRNPATQLLQAQLLALLNSQEAREFTVSS